MPFDDAEKFIEDYLLKRHDDLLGGKRQSWATDTVADIPKLIAKFDSTTEDTEWVTLWQKKQKDFNELMGLRGKIAWQCGVRRDLRTQFAAGKDNRLRGSIDHLRFEAVRALWAKKSLVRLRELLDKRKPLT